MSYEPTNWKAGDTVTSAKLNKLEQGIAGAGRSVLFVNMIRDDNNSNMFRLDKTAGEIYEAFRNGNVRFIFKSVNNYESLLNLSICEKDSITGYLFRSSELPTFYAVTADDYPTTEQSVT